MNSEQYIHLLSSIEEKKIVNTCKLLDEGATIPFIARYRKEATGGLDEVQVAQIRDYKKQFEELLKRKEFILESIADQGKLTNDLQQKITDCFDSNELEDLYLPYKQKRQTRGDKARKLGLEPLAKMIMSQRGGDPEMMAERFVKGEVLDEEMALQGACDIMAEWMNETANLRARLRQQFQRKSILQSKMVKGKEDEGAKYRDYFDFSEPLYRCASHRLLAILRAEREGVINVKVQPQKEECIQIMERFFVKGNDECADLVAKSCKDAYQRLIAPSLETEVKNEAKLKADLEAIKIFSTNLRQLLLAPPLGSKRVLAIDPGFRTGCKVVCLDESGDLLHNVTLFPHPPQNESGAAQAKLAQLVESYKIDAIAIGDGTAGRETEALVKRVRFNKDIEVFVVREDGASIYSASPVARKEFPNYDVTVRGAVSIGRRLMDPLAELVKIDPKSVGVGQYQHDVNQSLLKDALDDVVLSTVNSVGVDLNTASPYLLAYVSGLGQSLAENIVAHRQELGGFKTREELRKVKRLGDKAFEQSAGFLRVRDGHNPLDNTAVHPEAYEVVNSIANKLGLSVAELIGNQEVLSTLKPADFPQIDTYTFKDLVAELQKPSRDPRKAAKILEFDSRVRTIEDLKEGMLLTGIVTNITAFGAFVNLGIKENGLIHKSNMSSDYVEDPATVVSLHQHVEVRVLEVDVQRKRIGLQLMH